MVSLRTQCLLSVLLSSLLIYQASAATTAAATEAAATEADATEAAATDAAVTDAAATDAAVTDAAGTGAAGTDAAGTDAAGTDAAGTDVAGTSGGNDVTGGDDVTSGGDDVTGGDGVTSGGDSVTSGGDGATSGGGDMTDDGVTSGGGGMTDDGATSGGGGATAGGDGVTGDSATSGGDSMTGATSGNDAATDAAVTSGDTVTVPTTGCVVENCMTCSSPTATTCQACEEGNTPNGDSQCLDGTCASGLTTSVVNGVVVCSQTASPEQKAALKAEFTNLPSDVENPVIFELPPGLPASVDLASISPEAEAEMETALTDSAADECKTSVNATFYCGLTDSTTKSVDNIETDCAGTTAIALANIDKGTSGMAMYATCNISSTYCACAEEAAVTQSSGRKRRAALNSDLVLVPADAFASIVTESISAIAEIVATAFNVVLTADQLTSFNSAVSTADTYTVSVAPVTTPVPTTATADDSSPGWVIPVAVVGGVVGLVIIVVIVAMVCKSKSGKVGETP